MIMIMIMLYSDNETDNDTLGTQVFAVDELSARHEQGKWLG